MDTDEKYARIIELLESIERIVKKLETVLDQFKPLLEKVQQRLTNVRKWGGRD